MDDLKLLDISVITGGPFYHSGAYINKNGEGGNLTNPQVETIEVLKSFSTPAEQFDFFCYAQLSELSLQRMIPYGCAVDVKYTEYMKKFGTPWYSTTRRTLPDFLGVYDLRDFIKEDQINFDLLKEKYELFSQYKFFLYKFDFRNFYK